MASPPANRVRGEEDASARDTVSSRRRWSCPILRNGRGDLRGIRALLVLRIYCGHHEIVRLPRLNAAVHVVRRGDGRRSELCVGAAGYGARIYVVAGHRGRAG